MEMRRKSGRFRGVNPGEYVGMAKHARKERSDVVWYVIQTISGREKELVEVIGKVLAGDGYDRCFVLLQECVWRLEGQYRVHIEPLFPSYVFVETSTPKQFFLELKRVPRLTKLLGENGIFLAVERDEEKLLRQMIGEDQDYIVRRSLVRVDVEGNIISAEGVLKNYIDVIVKKRLRKRRVVIEVPFLGKTRRIQLAIRLEGDTV